MSTKSLFTQQNNCTDIDWQQIADMFLAVGWNARTPENIQLSFERSSHVCFIKEGNDIIAFGRTVDDGLYYGLIVDVAVRPDKQALGLGTQIVSHLRDQMKGYSFITLTAAPGKDGFYEKTGWKKQKSAFIWPRDSKQEEQHCF